MLTVDQTCELRPLLNLQITELMTDDSLCLVLRDLMRRSICFRIYIKIMLKIILLSKYISWKLYKD